MSTRMHQRSALILLALPLLAACGGSEGTVTPTPTTYTKLGLVQYIDFGKESGVVANFRTIAPTALPGARDTSSLDTCQLGQPDGVIFGGIGLTNIEGTSLDAGATVSLKKNGAAFASLPRDSQGTTYSYVLPVNLVGQSNVTVSAAGAEGGFPAFADVPVLAPAQASSFTSPADLKAVKASTTFTWKGASNDPDATMVLGVKQNSSSLTFYCLARDDGSFSIPADFQSLLTNQKFTVGELQGVQIINRSLVSSGALFYSQRLTLLK
jgi:hypothetical protein